MTELMISGAGCELILNLETSFAARCQPALSTSPGRTVMFAQLPLPETRSPLSVFTVPLDKTPLVGKVPVPEEGAELSLAGSFGL